MITWPTYISQLNDILSRFSVRDAGNNEVGREVGFSLWKDLTVGLRSSGNRAFFIGNGASASMASHFAADLAKSGRILTEVFTDLSLITATANDIAYKQVFAEPLRFRMSEGDMLVAISSSGTSPNVVRGAQTANELGGTVITLSAMREGNPLRKLGNLNFYISAQTYGLAETGHAAILHYWMDMVEVETRTGSIAKEKGW